MSLTTRSVVQPLRFHKVHDENIRLMNNKTVAFRHEGFTNGLAFSDRPIGINEPVFIRILDVSNNICGVLRFGFTIHDPEFLKCKLTHFTSPDYATAMNGYWGKALADRWAKKFCIFYYFVDHKGNVHYGINSENCGIHFGGVNTSGKLWAVLDIFGSTRSVELMNRFTFNDEMTLMPFLTKLNYNILFHAVHGRNVRLNSSRNIGIMKSISSKESYTFTDRCLRFEEKLVLQVLATNMFGINFFYGVTSCNPSTLVPELLPDDPEDLVNRAEYWVVKDDTHCYSRGDFIVYSINSEGIVKVSKNDLFETAKFYVDHTQPLWGFFNISGNISELEIMGTFVSAETHNDTSELEQEPVIEDSLPKEEPSNEASGTSGEQEQTKCAICSECFINNAVYSCGHLCLCDDCAVNVMKSESNVQFCPICGEPIKDVFEIFP
ncbi:hypothetical protein JTE90_021776 [Oedothorax gibbosus]|uniref:RING-type domain-containing protein n=1 Tax=Oedothorax gibbosus TaxID=931172 RepID=A0AAV6US90_9ARAC|nr:hypothetical protein JTE90_021776 [Oedothorax gibbosus]